MKGNRMEETVKRSLGPRSDCTESVQKKSTDMPFRCGQQEMDGKLWSELPDDIVFMILTFLPWYSILRLRPVCMEWNSYLRGPEFTQNWAKRNRGLIKHLPLCCIGCKKCGYIVYSPSIGQIYGDSCSSLFRIMHFKDKKGVTYKSNNLRITGAARGLLLLQVFPPWSISMYKFDLFVINPIDSSTMKRVPQEVLPRQFYETARLPLGLVWNETSQTHRVLVQHLSVENRVWFFYSYDVQSDKWDQIAKWPMQISRRFQHPSMSEGQLFCLGKLSLNIFPHRCFMPSLERFRVYNLVSSNGNWLQEPTWVGDDSDSTRYPSLPYPLHFATIWHQNNQILVAGGKVSNEVVFTTFLEEFSVWRLEPHSSENVEEKYVWGVVQKMPDAFLEIFNRNTMRKQFVCAGHDRFLCVANSCGQAAIWDMNDNSWLMLPSHTAHHPDELEIVSAVSASHDHYLELHLCEPRFDVSF